MPVWRFTTFEDARRALLLETGDPSLPARLRGLWRTANRLAPATALHGVHKFACIEDANTERAARSTERIRRLRAARGLP
jgi:hypothetical protein